MARYDGEDRAVPVTLPRLRFLETPDPAMPNAGPARAVGGDLHRSAAPVPREPPGASPRPSQPPLMRRRATYTRTNKPATPPYPWTARAVARLRALAAEGKSASEIAHIIGTVEIPIEGVVITRNAIIGKLARLRASD